MTIKESKKPATQWHLSSLEPSDRCKHHYISPKTSTTSNSRAKVFKTLITPCSEIFGFVELRYLVGFSTQQRKDVIGGYSKSNLNRMVLAPSKTEFPYLA
jgi:hypothetical protein